MDTNQSLDDAVASDMASSSQLLPEPNGAAPAWELIDVGRYRPRRIRGSYRGRELG